MIHIPNQRTEGADPVSDLEEKIAFLERATRRSLDAIDQLNDRVAALTIINAVALAKLQTAGGLDLDNLRDAAASNLTTLGDEARRMDQIALHIEEIIGKVPAISTNLTLIKGGKQSGE